MQTLISWCYQTCIDILSPAICACCKDFLPKRDIFCAPCYARIVPIATCKLAITARYEVTVYAIADYQDPLRNLILAKNYGDRVSARQLGTLAWQMTTIKHQQIDFFVPVPLHWSRTARRGFNQAHEMAIALATESGAPVRSLLKRVKRTKFQAQLGHSQRAHNVQQAFELYARDVSVYHGKHLVVVDDLMTTGSTLKEAIQELRKLKPAKISVLVACRVV